MLPLGVQHSRPVLTPFDDYLVHQTPQPVAHPASSDPNVYDRYFFNGYAPNAELFFAAALGLYPNRQVMDAAFSVVRDGHQHSVHASRRAPTDRRDTSVRPLRVEVVEPLRTLRLIVEPTDNGLAADLTFTARSAPIEEPRYVSVNGTRTTMDVTRLTQFGTWNGTIEFAGQEGEVRAVLGTRDRSWGIRPVGERTGGGAPGPLPQFFWLWAPLQFEHHCIHLDVNEDASGDRWHAFAARVEAGEGEATEPVKFASVDHEIVWRKGTRRAESAKFFLASNDGQALELELTPQLDFQMLGLGYLHPEWGHGMWKGEHAVHHEEWDLASVDPLDPRFLHVQQLCRVTANGEAGVGILEQLVIGPHDPSGFAEILDGAR